MRVLHVISDQNIGGAGVLLLSLLKHFNTDEVQSFVALPKDSLLRPRVEACGVPVYPLSSLPDRPRAASVREIKKLIQKTKPEILHTNAAISARISAKLCDLPSVYTRHCCFPMRGFEATPPVRLLKAAVNRSLNSHAIATAEAAAENLSETGVPKERIHIIINGSDPVREISEGERARYMKAWNLRKGDFTVGLCARMEPYKGHRTLLSAAEILRDCAPHIPFRFLLAGDGSEREALLAECYDRGLSEIVHFCGFLEDVAPFYRLLRVNVNCSEGTETSCLAISEGMSASLPTVASNYGGNPAMLGDCKAGFLFRMGDAEALSDCLLQLAEHPILENSMKRAALARYERYYTATRMAQKTAQVYREILEN